MKVLFITYSRIGDAVLSTGLIDYIGTSHPEARITLACGAAPAPLFANTPAVERIIVLRKRLIARHWIELWRASVASAWDLVIDLRGSLIAYGLWARRRRILHGGARDGHRVEALGALMGLDPPPSPRVWTSARDTAAADALIAGHPGPVLAVGPTANWPGKQWRIERFVELVERLTGPRGILPGAAVAILGAPSERVDAQALIEAVPPARRIDVLGRIDLPGAAALLARCALFIGNDSGLMHLAAAAGTPVLGLFGPSRDAHYAPWGTRTAVVRTAISYDDLFEPGYDHRSTGTLMDSLSVDAAEAAARALWARCGTQR